MKTIDERVIEQVTTLEKFKNFRNMFTKVIGCCGRSATDELKEVHLMVGLFIPLGMEGNLFGINLGDCAKRVGECRVILTQNGDEDVVIRVTEAQRV
jgi:hypothetical protein